MKDPRVAKLIRALELRFPGTTVVTRPMMDQPGSGELRVSVLNAPMTPVTTVDDFANPLIDELWGDDPVPVFVSPVSPQNTRKYYAEHVRKARRTRRAPRKARAKATAAK